MKHYKLTETTFEAPWKLTKASNIQKAPILE